MSADNTIAVLKTIAKNNPILHEYRIKHLQALENYQWNHKTNDYSADDDMKIINAREMWNDCKVFNNETDALVEAKRQYDEIMNDDGIVEYGICFVEIDRVF